jgi:hypothetical protein
MRSVKYLPQRPFPKTLRPYPSNFIFEGFVGLYTFHRRILMPTPRLTHFQREQAVLNDLETHFPEFACQPSSWAPIPEGSDPPDFIGTGRAVRIGLELVEWLDGDQMSQAKRRESIRDQIVRLLARDWEREYRPQNFRAAFIEDREERIVSADAERLRAEFFSCAANVDRAWVTNEERFGGSYYQNEFPGFPLLGKYFLGIRYLGGEPHGLRWMDVSGDGGAFDPSRTLSALKDGLDAKMDSYFQLEKQRHLAAHGLDELCLLVHGGFNAFAYNTPSGPLSLDDIAKLGSAFYGAHPRRELFSRVWLFDSLDTADEINQAIGFPAGYGRVRWLAQLWPEFRVYAGPRI